MIATIHQVPLETSAGPWRISPAIAPEAFDRLRRQLVLEHCKWDPQVGDVSTLAPFPLILQDTAWQQLAAWSEQLTTETLAAEQELLRRPELHRRLAVPRKLRRVLRHAEARGVTPAAARVMRFDFHFTKDGWRISEVNSDVPGGFTESSSFTALMAAHYPEARSTGAPVQPLVEALGALARSGGVVGLVCATGFMEDQQIMAYLGRRLAAVGVRAVLLAPQQIFWHEGAAELEMNGRREPVCALVRFYQCEWLARLPGRYQWSNFLCGGRTPVTNPGLAVLSESKRFPLVWDELKTPLPTWRALLPETRDPRTAQWRTGDEWLLKSAYCNTGDTVAGRSLLPAREWRALARAAYWQPGGWVAQRKFEAVPVATPWGTMHPCVGVYTIDGRVAGSYARIAPRPIINFEAIDIALLVEKSAP
jgi:glutathionylspermidine synthase